ncbi:hypothetical protein [Streptosporangium sp. NPDC051022]|uniref:hypothetical protein n=1 Tax=Streptosporangium sp. NPDC051022 TaxID=3155752 RepID=UPI00342805C7
MPSTTGDTGLDPRDEPPGGEERSARPNVGYTRLIHSFQSFADVDPGLPASLAMHADARDQAIRVVEESTGVLLDPAARYFRRITQDERN